MLTDKVGRPIQESLLALLIYDDQYGGVVAKLLSPEMFDGDYADIARRVGSFWHSYNKAPKRQVDDLFSDIFTERTGRDVTYGDLFIHLLELHDGGINAQFLLDSIHKFTRFQSLKRLLIDSAEKAQNLGEDSLEEIDRALAAYNKTQVDSASSAMTLFDYETVLAELHRRSVEFDTGIKELDRGYIVPARGRLMLVIAPPNVGKSWALIQLARRALLRRKRVLFVSCEMAAHEVATRFYQALLGVSTRDAESVVTRFVFEEGQFKGFEQEKVPSDFTLMDENLAHIELAVRISRHEALFKNLRIREYAMGQLTPEILEAAIDLDASTTGFVPDIVITDYIGIFKLDPNNLRISLGHAGIGLKRIARERNVAMVTAQQVSREGVKEQKAGREVDIEHTAEDWSLMGTADTVVTLSQTKAERAVGLTRLFVGKGRQEAARFAVLVSQNYNQGQFAVDSYRIPTSYSRVLEEFMKDRERDQEADDEED